MAKYSFEFKKKIVEEYLEGEGSYLLLSEKHGIPNKAQLQRWVMMLSLNSLLYLGMANLLLLILIL